MLRAATVAYAARSTAAAWPAWTTPPRLHTLLPAPAAAAACSCCCATRVRPRIICQYGFNHWELTPEPTNKADLTPSSIAKSEGTDFWSCRIKVRGVDVNGGRAGRGKAGGGGCWGGAARWPLVLLLCIPRRPCRAWFADGGGGS